MSELYKKQRTDLDKKIQSLDKWIGEASQEPDGDEKTAILQALTSAQRHYNEKRIKLNK